MAPLTLPLLTVGLQCCEEALKRGWNVEVYAWGTSISHAYRRLRQQFPQQMTITSLDTLRDIITYRQPRGLSLCADVSLSQHARMLSALVPSVQS